MFTGWINEETFFLFLRFRFAISDCEAVLSFSACFRWINWSSLFRSFCMGFCYLLYSIMLRFCIYCSFFIWSLNCFVISRLFQRWLFQLLQLQKFDPLYLLLVALPSPAFSALVSVLAFVVDVFTPATFESLLSALSSKQYHFFQLYSSWFSQYFSLRCLCFWIASLWCLIAFNDSLLFESIYCKLILKFFNFVVADTDSSFDQVVTFQVFSGFLDVNLLLVDFD